MHFKTAVIGKKNPTDTCVLGRLHCIQRCGFWRDVSRKHGDGRWLRRIYLRVPGQLQFLRGDVEAGGTDLLAGKPVQSCGWTWDPTEGGLPFYRIGGDRYTHILDCWLVFMSCCELGTAGSPLLAYTCKHKIYISCCGMKSLHWSQS